MEKRLSETPTDAELRDYLIATVRMSPLAWNFADSEFNDDKLDRGYVRTLRAFASSAGGSAFVARLVDTLHEALRRLNAIPRDDPFWSSRNKQPTLYKLRDLNAEILRKQPGDPLALWTQAALYLLHGSTNFGHKQWRRLHHEGDFDVSWPIMAALVTELNAEATGEALVELIDRIEEADAARAVLRSLDEVGDPWILEWRDGILAALDA